MNVTEGGAMVRWPGGLERWTGDALVQGSNPAAATHSLRNFGFNPALPVSFGGDTESRRSLLPGVYARGSKISHQSALEMCKCNSIKLVVDSTTCTSSWNRLEINLKMFVSYPVNMMWSKENQIKSNQINKSTR